jgi:peptidoglycan-associated lipoprotein
MNKKSLILGALFVSSFLAGCSSTGESYTESAVTNSSDPLSMETLFSDSSVVYTEQGITDAKHDILTEESGRYSAEAFLVELGEQGVDLSVIETGTIQFEFDSARLTDEFKQLIAKHVDLLRETTELKVILEGHTDSAGDRSYNLKLGERRALAVKEYAVSLGALPRQIEVISYGEEKLLNSEDSEQDKQENRRAVFVYK